jgi:hypothetical protein
MANGKLFEYAILWHPKDGGASQIVKQPTTIIAPGDRTAALMAARAIPETHLDKIDEIEVLVRPF